MLSGKIDPEAVEVIGEKGNTFYFRPLSGDELDEAEAMSMREAALALGREAAGIFGEMQSPESQKQVTEMREKMRQEKQAAGEEEDPLDTYSRKGLLVGLVKWEGENYDGIKCDEKGKTQLMEPVRSWAALQVHNRSVVTAGKEQS